MGRPPQRRIAVWLISIVVLAVFLLFPHVQRWQYLSMRDFTIPVAGGPYLRSADDWQSETSRLLSDTTAFWSRELARVGQTYPPPDPAQPFGALKRACTGQSASEAPVNCAELEQVDGLAFNGISRQAGIGMNHLAIAYTVAHLVGHRVQAALGELERPAGIDLDTHRHRVELQAECYAGFWLRHGTADYGTVTPLDLRRVVPKIYLGAVEARPLPDDGSVKDRDRLEGDLQVASVLRGFSAAKLDECRVSAS